MLNMEVGIKGICLFCVGILFSLSTLAMEKKVIPTAYIRVANAHGVPPSILYAIALTESGYTYARVYNPWPWTLNVEGESKRFLNLSQTLAGLNHALDQGKRVDIGIMQVNSFWHSHRVDSIEHLLDPYVNLHKGAEILLEQKRRSTNQGWWEAVGKYHAPGNDKKSLSRAAVYRDKVKKKYETYIGESL